MTLAKEVIDTLHQRIKELAVNSTADQLAYLAKSLELIIDKSTISNITQMTAIKEIIDSFQKRLKDLAATSTPDQLAYLAKTLESIIDKSAVSDIAQMADGKLKELLDSTKTHLSDINTNKTNSISAITATKTESIDQINTLKTESLSALETLSGSHISLLDTRKDTNVAAINSIFGTINDVPSGSSIMKEIKTREDQLKKINDVPSGSSIMKEIKNRNMIEPEALPFLFGVLSRNQDYGGSGTFTTELGKWYDSNADSMLQLLSGSNTYNHQYSSFCRPPQLYFLQGKNGKFIYREAFLRHAYNQNQHNYPYALLGVIFVKNTTNSNITRTLDFGGSSGWISLQYGGASLFIATPDNTNANKVKISAITWINAYSYSEDRSAFSHSISFAIPAGKTVAILLYTSAFCESTYSYYYKFFMYWSIYNFRSNFLTTGLEVDIERTLKAWQCPGLDNTYKLWH